MSRAVAILGTGLLTFVLAACNGSAGPSVAPQTLAPDSPTIVAKDLKFLDVVIVAPANRNFALDFDNEDTVPHNVTIYSTGGATMFKGEIFSGVGHRIYSVAALPPGRYQFKCEVHPDMAGELSAQ